MIQITPADKSSKKSNIPDAKLRADTLAKIKDSKADYTIYTDSSAKEGL